MPVTRRNFLQGGFALAALPRTTKALSSLTKSPQDELWYLRPAERWLEALPIGNGRLGGMIFGGAGKERIALSEATAWSGAPGKNDVNPGAIEHLAEIRQLLFSGKYVEARDLSQKHLLGRPTSFGTNLPLPELQLSFEDEGASTQYRRALSLDEAVARVDFRRGEARFSREVIASHPDDVIAVRLTCSKPGQFSFAVGFGAITIPADITTDEQNTLVLRGHAFERLHSNGRDGVALQIHAKIIAEGGNVSAARQSLQVKNADAVTVLIAIGTNFGGSDPEEACVQALSRASRKSYAQLRAAHVADHQSLYRRVTLNLGASSTASKMQPTDVRRKAFAAGTSDPELLALFFQYGRYLTIAGSRADSSLPLALQGIWNDGLASSMGWTNDYHLDINTQQNYWAAEVCNLSECQTPLFGLIDGLREAGRRTAKEMYGVPGWVCHTVTNAWGYTAPGWGIGWGLFVTAGIWIALQMWDHYTFNADVGFLRARVYPVLREAAEFFLAYMVPEPKHGWLVTGPSDSPENWFLIPEGERCAESMGNTVDRVFVYALYSMCIEASKILSVDAELRSTLESARAKLPPFQIGRHGQLQEWLEDFEDGEPNHRHTAHLVALYPENQISPRTTPELARAAEVTIQRRMNTPNWEQSEWGRANLVVYYARLLNGDSAHKYLEGLVAKAADDNLLTFSSGGIAGAEQNIFAIDGNTAGAAGIAEMLLQSQGGEIQLLPALPSAWPSGSVKGLCARGGFKIDLTWQNGALLSAAITSKGGGDTPVRYGNEVLALHLRPGEVTRLRPESFKRRG
ncbi:MAG TPA: glycoside hydrolase family 95 protein [Alloacidobacterium sp.]|nr:glycoside hydrolase family 95 protein [Alloacidobacterium sp.]